MAKGREEMKKVWADIRATQERLAQMAGEALRPYYQMLYDIGLSDKLPVEGKGKRRPPGRPALPENEWAYEQVNGLGRPPAEVHPEWLEKLGDRAETLQDPQDSFKQAIRRKRGKKLAG